MRFISGFLPLLFVLCPAVARGQSFQVHGAAGVNVVDTGHNLSYGFDPGFSLSTGAGVGLTPRLTLSIEIERTHRARQLQTDARGNVFGYPGGTSTLGVAQLRAALSGRDRIGPYVLVGLAGGVSRTRAIEGSPDRTHDVRAIVFGGGIHVPLGKSVSLFADGRMLLGGEGRNGVFGIAPIRAGLAWHF